MKDYRLDKSHIDAKLGENEPVKFDQPEGFIRDHVHECLQDIVEYTSCPAYNSVVPLSTHPHARTYLDELKYLLSNSNRASSEKIVMSSPMIDDELEALSDLMATSEWPIIIRSPTSLYAPNFFELSQVRNKTRKSEFHKVYPMTNRILLQDAYHPDFPKSRTSFSVQLEILTCTMNDPYSALQTVDCVGIATPNLAPQWLRPVILTTFEMIARALKAGDKSPVSNPQHLSAFLNVVQHLLNLEAKEAGTGSEDGASASTTIPERTKAAKKLLVEVKAFIERAPGGVRGLGKDAARR
ncbi:hypothetical protein FRB90_006128 [Tulasnella sp. 427]|nr:hypothetical protein FRB90_006128 [Tulasnella sp. 427]